MESSECFTKALPVSLTLGVPGGSVSKESTCNAGDLGSIPGSGRAPEEGNGNPVQYSCLENPMNGKAWWAAVHGVTESGMTEQPMLKEQNWEKRSAI